MLRKGTRPFPPPIGQHPAMKNMPIYEALAQAFAAEGRRHPFHPDGRRQHALGHRDEEPGRHEHYSRPARALRLRHGDGLSPRDRQGRRRLGDLRAGLHPDHDGARDRLARPHPAGGLRRRGADQRQMVQPGDRPAAARGRQRRALHLRAQPAAHASICARGVLHRAPRSASRSSSACPTICRSSRCRTSASISRRSTVCRKTEPLPPNPQQIDALVDKLVAAQSARSSSPAGA